METTALLPFVGVEGRQGTGRIRLQGIQDHLRERGLPDAAEDGLEGRRGSWTRGAGNQGSCQQVSTSVCVS